METVETDTNSTGDVSDDDNIIMSDIDHVTLGGDNIKTDIGSENNAQEGGGYDEQYINENNINEYQTAGNEHNFINPNVGKGEFVIEDDDEVDYNHYIQNGNTITNNGGVNVNDDGVLVDYMGCKTNKEIYKNNFIKKRNI